MKITKKELTNKAIAEEREELKAEIARLRGAMRAIEKLARTHLKMTPFYMLEMDGK